MAGKALISFSNSNSTFHLEGEIELVNQAFPMLEDGEPRILESQAILPPVRRGEGSSGHHDGSAELIEPRFGHSGSPFDRVLTFAEEDTKGYGLIVKLLPEANNGQNRPKNLINVHLFQWNDASQPSL